THPAPSPLALHDALPIFARLRRAPAPRLPRLPAGQRRGDDGGQPRARDQLLGPAPEVPLTRARRFRGDLALAALPAAIRLRRRRSEEHTSELQSRSDLVC